ncbi:hypothetical protein TSUD_401760 [Trifolium subterraneum]|uniref:Retrotransposon gag domain-containing protein n=1 Tax=Trifolium subterraneum TaxID=3900 RepID=A0A2Z6NPG9_TRISU|nr:hypothetical protein TSUD_401760 [Trifolium subterraneum]
MEARLEFLERVYEDYRATCDEVKNLQQQLEVQKGEAQCRVEELSETVQGLSIRHEQGSPSFSSQQLHNPEDKWRKLTIPIFDGEDAFGWTSRVERYFELRNVTEAEKIQATMVAMEGKALIWYQWWEFCSPNPTWEDFKAALLKRFQPSKLQTPYELLLSLKQTVSVEEYRAQFELYAGPLRAAEPEYLKGIFLNGLKDAVKAELKLHPVSSLPELMDFAQRVDEKNTLLNPSNSHAPKAGNFTRNFPSNCTVTVDVNKSSHARPAIISAATSDANTTSQSTPFRGRVFKKLTDAELQDKFAKGLCYQCDAKFSPGHSMSGLTSKKTIKLWGDLLNRKVLVLVDCGASHNFISLVLVQKLNLQNLALLGEVGANFGELILKVPTSSGFHVLQGDPTLSRAPASLKTMYKALQASGDGYLLQVEVVTDVSDQHNTVPTWLTTVLEDFKIVFQEIQGLPPSRTHDHAIVLQEGAAIPNLRPYRYPPLPKE